jgi:hypothetical protein
MATAYTPILKLALPVTGELQGTWGTVVNDNITSMIEQAIAGLATVNTWVAASSTLTTADGTTSQSRCAVLECSGAPGAAATVICPTSTKLYVIKNSVSGGFAVTLKTSAGTGILVPNGSTALLYCDGTNVVSGATYMATVSTTQVDILAQGDLRLQDSTGGEYVALQAPATLSASYTLTLPVDDGTAGQALITDGNGVLSWSSSAFGDVYGPASATDNAVARFDGTTGKLIQNSAVTIADDGATVLAANSASDALRITQIGAGNALVVEDSANPDATPFVVAADGTVILGNTTSVPVWGFANPLQVWGGFGYVSQGRFSNDAFSAFHTFVKSRSTTPGGFTVVQSGDEIGRVAFAGADGSAYIAAAQITASVDGTPGTNDMPGRLVFSTTADGASAPTERMRIDSTGGVGIGSTALTAMVLRASKSITGGTSAWGIRYDGAVLSGVTAAAYLYSTYPSTQAAAFTLGNLLHYQAGQGTLGAGSSIGNQYGFYAGSDLVGATNNFGFYSNIASGTGRYNFYAAGTADNYFAGNVGIGITPTTYLTLNAAGQIEGIAGVAGSTYLWGLTRNNSNGVAIDSYGSTTFFTNSLTGSKTGTERGSVSSAGVWSLGAAVGSESLRVTPVASAVNYLNVQGATTTNFPYFTAQGSDTNVSAGMYSKGTGALFFGSNSGTSQFVISHTASAVNYLQVTGSATGFPVTFSAQGSDTNIDLQLTPKGTGNVRFGTLTANADAPITGYITIRDSGGTLRKLAVIA